MLMKGKVFMVCKSNFQIFSQQLYNFKIDLRLSLLYPQLEDFNKTVHHLRSVSCFQDKKITSFLIMHIHIIFINNCYSSDSTEIFLEVNC